MTERKCTTILKIAYHSKSLNNDNNSNNKEMKYKKVVFFPKGYFSSTAI